MTRYVVQPGSSVVIQGPCEIDSLRLSDDGKQYILAILLDRPGNIEFPVIGVERTPGSGACHEVVRVTSLPVRAVPDDQVP